jgi:hypothetical protein
MTGAEAVALTKRRGVTLGVVLGKLRVYSEGEPDESLVRLLRDNKQAVMAAILAAETESAHWRRILAEKVEIIATIRGLPRAEAERVALAHVVVEYLDSKYANTDPTRCAWCGKRDAPDQTLLPMGVGERHAWLHSICVEPWRARRREIAVAELATMKIEAP